MQAAAAVFVKTPGLSAVKTRLAATLGQAKAEAFYLLSCRAMEEVLQRSERLQRRYWAIAESEAAAHDLWQGMSILQQGEGGLGERLHRIYSGLVEGGEPQFGILLGADAPQIDPRLIDEAVAQGQNGSFVVGPARDGGFYLFGGSQPLSSAVWTQVRYSQADTRAQLLEALGSQVPLVVLPELTDVDEAGDLYRLMQTWATKGELLAAQSLLRSWCEENITL